MPYSYETYSGDGSNQNFNVPFGYREQDDIHVYVAGVEIAQELLEFPSVGVVRTPTAPALGVNNVVVRRFTDAESLVTTLQYKSLLVGSTINDVLTQLLYIVQEAWDKAVEALTAWEAAEEAVTDLTEAAALSATNADNSAASSASSAGVSTAARDVTVAAKDAALAAVGAVKVTTSDTTPAVLNSKVAAAGLLTKSTTSPGGNEVLALDVPIASQAQAEAGAADTVGMTPLKAEQHLAFKLDTDVALTANSDSKIATQKAVKAYVNQIVAAQDAMVYKGVIDCSSNPNYVAADRGWTYRVSVAGKIGGASGPNVQVGDIVICLDDGTVSGTHAAQGSHWNIIQTNIDGALTAADIGVIVQAYAAALAQVAGLSPSDNDLLQRKAGAWTNRTLAQVLADLVEVGTFVPTVSFATPGDSSFSYTAQEGRYARIGSVVLIDVLRVDFTPTHTTASGNFQISGLPFAAVGTLASFVPPSHGVNLTYPAGRTTLMPRFGSSTVLNLVAVGSAVALTIVAAANMPTGLAQQVVTSGSYRTS